MIGERLRSPNLLVAPWMDPWEEGGLQAEKTGVDPMRLFSEVPGTRTRRTNLGGPLEIRGQFVMVQVELEAQRGRRGSFRVLALPLPG